MRIFLSYASEDKAIAEPIAFSLRSRGHSVFLDKDDLPAGRSYDEQIEKAIAQSDVLVFLISPTSVDKGRFTLTELEFARAAWRHPANRVLPVMVEPTPMDKVPAFLKGVTVLEPHGNVAAEVAAAAERLRGDKYARRVAWKAAAVTAAFTLLALGVLVALFASGLVSEEPDWSAPAPLAFMGALLGLPFLGVFLFWGPGLSWKSLLPVLAVIVIVLISDKFLPEDFVTTIDLSGVSKPDTAGEPQAAPNETMKQLLEQVGAANERMTILENLFTGLALSTLIILGALLGATPVTPPLMSASRWLVTILVAALIATATFLAVTIVSAEGAKTLVGVGGAFLWYAVMGGTIGYWIGRGKPA